MQRRVTARDQVESVLADRRFGVPAAPAGDRGLAWLRSAVCRFANGEEHARRRAMVGAELDGLDPETLRREARERAGAALEPARGRIEIMGTVARPVPLAALGRGLGLDGERLGQAVVDAIAVGPGYLSGTGDAGVDAAVERLRALLDRGSPDRTAAAIAVLAQAGEATAAPVGNALVLA